MIRRILKKLSLFFENAKDEQKFRAANMKNLAASVKITFLPIILYQSYSLASLFLSSSYTLAITLIVILLISNLLILFLACKKSIYSFFIPILSALSTLTQYFSFRDAILSHSYTAELSFLSGWISCAFTLMFLPRQQYWFLNTIQFISLSSVLLAIFDPRRFSNFGPLILGLCALGFVLYFYNIERFDREQFLKLRTSKKFRNQFKKLIDELIPEGIVILHKNLDKVIFANQAVKDYFGFENANDFLNLMKDLSMHAPYVSQNRPEFNNIAFNNNRERNSSMHPRIYHSKQKLTHGERTFEMKVCSFKWDGNPAILLVFTDLTYTEMIINMQEISKHKDEAIAAVSHELRAPTNSIMGMLQVAFDSSTESSVRAMIQKSRNTAKFLLSITNSFLDLEQIRNKKLSLNFANQNISELLDEIRSMVEFQANAKGLVFSTSTTPTMPKVVNTDTDRLKQILINLLSNALKYTRKGEITLGIKWLAPERPNCYEFYVQDTGTGIKKEDINKLFRPYGRIQDENAELNRKGVGLGLLISMNLAVLLGPSDTKGIQVTSIVSVGSKFSFEIESKGPFEASSLEEQQSGSLGNINLDENEDEGEPLRDKSVFYKAPKQCADKGRSPNLSTASLVVIRKSRIMVVDDNPFNIIAIKGMIDHSKYDTLQASDGEECLSLVKASIEKKEGVDIIFLDCQMPILDGYETAKTLSEWMAQGTLPKVPIIGLTADPRIETKNKCLECGMDDFAVKPMEKSQLQQMLKKWLVHQNSESIY